MPMVVLRIPDGSALVYIEKADPSVYFKIYDLLTYKKDYGKWEKPESLYDPYEKTFPVGLLPRVKKFLNSKGYRVRVKDERQIRGEKLNSTWNEKFQMRRYQEGSQEGTKGENGRSRPPGWEWKDDSRPQDNP